MSSSKMSGLWSLFSLSVILNLCLLCKSQVGNILHYQIFEEEQSNKFVGNVKVDSKLATRYTPEIFSKLEFNFRYANGMYSLFTIDLKTGVIRTSRSIDREDICEYQSTCDIDIDIKVTPVQYFEIIKVKVKIIDINDNLPTFPQQQISTLIAETTMLGALIPIPSADDKDSGIYGIEGYRMITDDKGSKKFDLQVTEHSDGSMDVNILLLEKLDREQEEFYSLVVYAYDGDNPQHSGSISIDITVSDANDNAPKFDNSTYETTIYENLPFRSTIIQVRATDKDTGLFGEVVYSFSASTEDKFGSLFGIDNITGEIYVKGLIDYETSKLYALDVQARDKGENSLPTFAKVKIHVIDLNDHAPQISTNVLTSSGNAEIQENAATGTFIAHISVMDPDLGDSGLFDCQIDNDAFQLLPLSGSTMEYKIISRKKFDREEQTQYHIVLLCEDHGMPVQRAVKQIIVNVLDENDNAPIFSKGHYYASMPENNSLNAYILKIDAEDKDAGRNAAIKYSIKAKQGKDNNVVVIDAISGVVKANTIFNYEVKKAYEFVITASDHGNPVQSSSVEMSLSIEDVNDEYPVFTQDICFFKLEEGQAIETRVGKVTATDADSNKFNNITYSIDPIKAGSEDFVINGKTGEIFSKVKLDREKQEIYHLDVIAANAGYKMIRSKKECTIHVLDINDNPPFLRFPSKKNHTIQISNLVPIDYQITKIQAHDPDSEDNGNILYHISEEATDSFFKVNEISGELKVAKSLKSIDHQVIKLSVSVTDKGEPPKVSNGELNIIVDKSVASPLTQSGSFLEDHLMVIIGALLGLVFIIIIITVLLCGVKYYNRRTDKGAKYNCRLAANQKNNLQGGMNGGNVGGNGGDMQTYEGDSVSMKSDCSMDSPTKEIKSLKKEVTFTFDHDEAYMQKSPGGRTLTQETSLSQDPSLFISPTKKRRPQPSGELSPNRPVHPDSVVEPGVHPLPPVRPVVNKYPHITDPRKYSHQQLGLRHYDRSPTHPGQSTLVPGGKKLNNLTQRSLEMHDILNLSNHTDMDSECSGTDSGRGPSEEGDNLMLYGNPHHISSHPQYTNPQYRIDPYYTTGESTNVKKVPSSKSGPLDISKPAESNQITTKSPIKSLGLSSEKNGRDLMGASPPKLLSQTPITIKPQPVNHAKNNLSSTKSHLNERSLSPPKTPVRTVSNSDNSNDQKQWDPLNHHTQRRPKQLDARDLIPLQTDLRYINSGLQKSPPPIPPKRNLIDIDNSHSNFKDQNHTGLNKVQNSHLPYERVPQNSDYNCNYGNKNSAGGNANSNYNTLYDVPSSLKCANNVSPVKNTSSCDNEITKLGITSNQLPSSLKSSEQNIRKDLFSAGPKKEVRFAEDFRSNQKLGINTDTSSNDGLSDDETCTSGSYILDPSAALNGESDTLNINPFADVHIASHSLV